MGLPRWHRFALLAGSFLVSPVASAVSTSTAVQKVIELLQRLDKQIAAEGQDEAAEYDKYACFCKEKADNYQYAIEKSEEKITALDAKILKLGGEIGVLDADVITLGTRIGVIAGDITTEEGTRKTELDAYILAEKNITEAIDSVQRAIKAMREQKGKMSEDTKLNLAQMAELALLALPAEEHHTAMLVSLAQRKPGDPAGYTYKSNDIIATLQSLEKTFKENKQDSWDEEFKAKDASAKKILGLSKEKKFKEKSKTDKEELSAEKGTEKTRCEGDKTQEETDRDADKGVRGDLETACQNKAGEWDQRSQVRAAEITAIAECLEKLKSGVAENYGANKKLVGLVTRSASVSMRRLRGSSSVPTGMKRVPVTLLQINGATDSHTSGLNKALAMIAQAAVQLNSPSLAVLKAKIGMKKDDFVKVRALINDLIGKLEAEATSEATQKTFCDTEMGLAIGDRDTEKLTMEDKVASIAGKKSEIVEFQEEISDLSKEIAELTKSLAEATELRQKEKEENEKTLKDAGEGKIAIGEAITILDDFYTNNALVQVRAGPDRDGQDLADMEPTTSFSGDYKGKQGASKGIIGLLNVILSDFERTETTVGQQETDAAGAYTTYESTTSGSIGSKEGLVTTKEGEVTRLDGEIVTAKDEFETAEGLHASALKELEKLKAMCIEGEESYAERIKKREQEIEALKEALTILDDYKR